MLLLAIDPGIKGLGWALFEHRQLARCGVVPEFPRVAYQAPDLGDLCSWASVKVSEALGGAKADAVAVERMRHYPGSSHNDAKANDLLDIQAIGAYVAGACAVFGTGVHYYAPQEWKGSTPKAVMGRRILAALTPHEAGIAAQIQGSKAHNATDAIGIGLHHLARLGR